MGVIIKDKGFDKLQKGIKELGAQKHVSFVELFPDRFIQKHTKFQSLQELVDASGVEDDEEIRGEPFSQFVAGHSDFGSWQEMVDAAGLEYVSRKLGF